MKFELKIYLKDKNVIHRGDYTSKTEADKKIKEILKNKIFETNRRTDRKYYYPLHMIEKFEVTRIKE